MVDLMFCQYPQGRPFSGTLADSTPSLLTTHFPENHVRSWSKLGTSCYEVEAPFPIAKDRLTNSLADDNIQVPIDNLKALNLTSVYLKDGSGGLVSLGVHHALHCLVRTRCARLSL